MADSMLGVLGAAVVKVTVDAADLNKELTEIRGDVEKRFGELGSVMSGIGVGLTAGITAPLAAMGAASLSAALDFNKAMANIATLIPGNTERINEMKTALQGMAVETGKGTGDLAAGLYELISTIGDSADTLDILEINAKAAAAGLATTTEAINFTTAVTKTYGDTSKEAFEQVANMAFQAINVGKTTFPELSAAIGKVAPIAESTGVSMKEMFAVIATFTGVTGNTSQVVTQMAASIASLVNPSKEMEQVYEHLGIKSGEAAIKQHGLVGTMQMVEKGAKQLDIPLMKVVGRKEAWLLATSAAGTQAVKFSKNLDDMGKDVTALDKSLKEQQHGINETGFLWEQASARFEVARQKLGDGLMPALKALFENVISPGLTVLETLVAGFANLPMPIQAVAIGAAAVAAALGPMLIVIGGIVSSLPTMVAGYGMATKAMAGMATASTLASAALAGVGVAIAAWSFSKVYEAGSLLTELWQQSRQANTDAQNYAKQGARAMAEALRTTGLEAKDHAEALDLIRARLSGVRGETATTTDQSSKLYAAWQRGKADAHAYAEEQRRLAENTRSTATASGDAARKSDELRARVQQLSKDTSSLDADERRAIVTRDELGDKTADLAKDFKVSEAAIKEVIEAHKEAEQASKAHKDAMQKLIDQYSGKDAIDNAKKMSEALRAVGTSALTDAEASQMAKAFGDALDKMVKRGETQKPEFKRLTNDFVAVMVKEFETTKYENDIFWANFFKDPPNAQTGKQVATTMTKWMNDQVIGSMKPTKAENEKFWTDFLGAMPDVTPDMSNFKPSMLKGIKKELSKGEFALEMGQVIIDGIVSGRSAEEIGNAIGGMVGFAIGLGISSGNPIVAQALGTAGALIGEWIGGLFGGNDEEQAAVRQMRDQMLAAFGGLPSAFQEIAEAAGIAQRQIDILLRTGDPEQFQRTWDAVQPILLALQEEYAGLAMAIEGVNKVAEGLGKNLEKSITSQKDALTAAHEERLAQLKHEGASEEDLAALRAKFAEDLKKHTFTATEEQQIAVDRLGTFTAATFADMVRRTGDATSAVLAMKPAFETLKKSLADFGLEGNTTTRKLVQMYDTITSNEDVFSSISGLGKVMEGLGKAVVTNKELATSFGQEMAFQLRTLEDRGVDTRDAMALMQPQLQMLWESQEKFGEFTDEGTRAMLDQAEQYKLVGPDMRDTNKQILDVLVEIRDMFQRDIPGAIPRTQSALDGLRAPNLRGTVTFDVQNPPGVDVGGGTVTVDTETRHGASSGIYGNWGSGTPVMLHGPEVVWPLDRFEDFYERQWAAAQAAAKVGNRFGGGDILLEVPLVVDGHEWTRATVRITQDALERGELRVPSRSVRDGGVR
jgi:TP901 family phage tail tape measure protein